jgi:Ca2+-binding RTX toxin-like protein
MAAKLDGGSLTRSDAVVQLALSSAHQAAWNGVNGLALGSKNLAAERDWIVNTGDDRLNGGSGSDILRGGDGHDTVVYTGKLSDYKFLLGHDGQVRIAETRASGDIDVIDSIEAGEFSGVKVDLAFTQLAPAALQKVAMLYQTVLGRTAELPGLVFWAGKTSLSDAQLAGGFVQSAEFQKHYGTLSDAAFVAQLYENGTHHAADAGTLATWQTFLSGHTREETAVAMAASQEFRD